MASIPPTDREVVAEARRWARSTERAWLAPWAVVIVIVIGAALEWTHAPVEKLLGTFMTWSQPARAEMGRGWDLNREGAEALEALAGMAETTRQRRAAGSSIGSLLEIPALLDSFQVFSISPDRFLTLYGDLPAVFQDRLLDPVALLRARAGGQARRMFFVNEDGRYRVYMVNADNVSLVEGTLTQADLDRLKAIETPSKGSIDAVPGLPLVIDDDLFFASLSPSGPVELNSEDLTWITSLEGELVRVGMASRPVDGIWPFGFEVRHAGQIRVYHYWLAEDVGRALLQAIQSQVPLGGMDL